jgi:hypothetical protein
MKLNFERNDCGLGLANLRHLGNDIAHQTGAALTYVRRSGLFTVVGGEDDVDAPDLAAPTQQPSGRERLKRVRMTGWTAETGAEVQAAVVVAAVAVWGPNGGQGDGTA